MKVLLLHQFTAKLKILKKKTQKIITNHHNRITYKTVLLRTRQLNLLDIFFNQVVLSILQNDCFQPYLVWYILISK